MLIVFFVQIQKELILMKKLLKNVENSYVTFQGIDLLNIN